MKLRLYHYWRSSSSWRVRMGLTLKGVPYEAVAIDLLQNQSESPEHLLRNPMGFVPTLERVEGTQSSFLSESVAILEWLNEAFTNGAPFFPHDPWMRAHARALAEIINAGTQPLQNLGPQELHSADPAERKAWAKHWITLGLSAYEKQLAHTAGEFSVGDQFGFADFFLIPQLYNARRYEVELQHFPKCLEIETRALSLPSVQASHPDRFQP